MISYYDSEDDVGKGSKGSIKMSVCDIKGWAARSMASPCPPLLRYCESKHGVLCYVPVHPTDLTRLELIIPGEQHFYVRAVNAAERQRWLVALGSSKAGTLDSHKHKGTRSSFGSLSVCRSRRLLKRSAAGGVWFNLPPE